MDDWAPKPGDDDQWTPELGEWYVLSQSSGMIWAGPFSNETAAQGWLDVFSHRETLPLVPVMVVAYDDLVLDG